LRKIKTTGGTFNPDEYGIYFPATDLSRLLWNIHLHRRALVPLNLLLGRSSQERLDTILSHGTQMFIDSGCFFLASEVAKKKGITIGEAFGLSPAEIPGYEAYKKTYIDFALRYKERIWGIVEMDFGGVEGKTQFREEVKKKGIKPIPVYHLLVDPAEYLDELLSKYDRVCIGNLAVMNAKDRKKVIPRLWEATEKHPKTWVHLLGVTPHPILTAYPFHSCDSSTWVAPLKWTEPPRTYYMYAQGGYLPPGYRFIRGVERDSPAGSAKAAGLSIYECLIRDMNHSNHLNAIPQ
jgi:hypothetical protein